MSLITRQIIKEVEGLPEQMQEEALNFVQFLKNKVTKKKSTRLAEPPNGTELAKIMAEIAQRGTAFRDIKNPSAPFDEQRET